MAGLSDEGLSAVWGQSLLVSNPNPRGVVSFYSQSGPSLLQLILAFALISELFVDHC